MYLQYIDYQQRHLFSREPRIDILLFYFCEHYGVNSQVGWYNNT